jgi:uncharacterized protein YraI
MPTFTVSSARWASALLVAASATLAQAEPAHTSKNVHLRAGPARDYPVVAILPAGLEIEVRGCLADYRWCDVIAGVQRGWVYAANITYAYQGNEVPVLGYGQAIGIAVLAFALFDYWGEHYRTRPWYPDRQRWLHTPHRLPPPQPAVPHPQPPRGEPVPRPPVPRPPVPPRAGPPSDHRAPPRAEAPSERRAPPPSQGAPHATPPAPQPAPPGPRPAPGQRQAPGSHAPRDGG